MKNNVLKIGQGKINEIASTLLENNISGKILYITDLSLRRLARW